MRLLLVPLALAGCQNSGPYIDPCVSATRTLPADEVSAIGFAADALVASFGERATVDVEWLGRHSSSPPSDTIAIAIAAITGDVAEMTHTAASSDVDDASCTERDTLTFARDATFATADGEVSGTGVLTFTVTRTGIDGAALYGTAPVSLSAARQAEVDLAIGDDLPPPESVSIHVGRHAWGDNAEITAEGESYGVAVWKCDEQHHEGCVNWR